MRLWGLLFVLLVACYQPPATSVPCAIACTDRCPGELTCEGGFCVEPGQVCRPAFVQVAAGTGFACGIDEDRALWCWGSNRHHQIEPGDRLQIPLATRISQQAWDLVEAGGEHVCGIAAGQLSCWGNNDHRQVAAAIDGDVDAPLVITVDGLPAWTAVSAGFGHTCAIAGGQLLCWGVNDRGQLGRDTSGADDGTPAPVTSPVTDWIAVAAGREHTCAISQTAGVHCWGANTAGELGPNVAAGLTQLTPIDVPLAAAPLLATSIAVTADASCATTPAGELYCWGSNASGELGDPAVLVPAPASSATPLLGSDVTGWTELAGSERMLCGRAAGVVRCWGAAAMGGLGGGIWDDTKAFGEVAPAAAQIAVGWSYELDAQAVDSRQLDLACALVGTEIACWGDNRFGQLGRGVSTMALAPAPVAGDHRFSDLQVGADHACAIEGERLYCWGSTVEGQSIGLVSGTASPRTPCVPELDCDVGEPKEIVFAAQPTGVAVGTAHTCALHNQVMTCWGDNSAAQLGSSAAGPVKRDVSGPMGRAWQAIIATGGDGQCATPAPDETWCWGNALSPQPAKLREPQLDGVKAIARGLDFTCILDRDDQLACLGSNQAGQFGNGLADATTCLPANGICDTGETAATCPADCCPAGVCGTPALTVLGRSYRALAASPNGRTACGILADGQVACWGANERGQTGAADTTVITPTPAVVPTLAGCTEIALASAHSCAICGGALRCWGDNQWGGLGAGDTSADPTPGPRAIADVLPGDPWVQLGAGRGFTCARSAAGLVSCWGLAPHAALGTGGMSANVPVAVLASPAVH